MSILNMRVAAKVLGAGQRLLGDDSAIHLNGSRAC
jgi:hypothetical protein